MAKGAAILVKQRTLNLIMFKINRLGARKFCKCNWSVTSYTNRRYKWDEKNLLWRCSIVRSAFRKVDIFKKKLIFWIVCVVKFCAYYSKSWPLSNLVDSLLGVSVAPCFLVTIEKICIMKETFMMLVHESSPSRLKIILK